MKHYFVVYKEDITQDLIDRSLQNNAFTIRKALDGSKWILKFDSSNTPLILYSLGYKSLSKIEMLSTIDNSGEW